MEFLQCLYLYMSPGGVQRSLWLMMCVSNLSLGKTPGILLRTFNLSTVKNFLSGTIDPVAYFSNRILFQLHTFLIAYFSRTYHLPSVKGKPSFKYHWSPRILFMLAFCSVCILFRLHIFCLHSFLFAYFSMPISFMWSWHSASPVW